MWNSAGINSAEPIDFTSLLVENNTFDNIIVNNQGRCFYFLLKGDSNDITIRNNTIQNCSAGGSLIKFLFQTRKSNFKIETFNFIKNSIMDCYSSVGPTPQIWVENVFDSSQTNDQYHICKMEFTVENCYNIIQNNRGTGCDNYFGLIDGIENVITISMKIISFINNTCDSLYGGGIGLIFKRIQQLTFDDCSFINNKAIQNTDKS